MSEKCAHKKAEYFQSLFYTKFCEIFPEKTRFISSDDQPFYSEKLKHLKRKKCREFKKRRRSDKYIQLKNKYEIELKKAKKNVL